MMDAPNADSNKLRSRKSESETKLRRASFSFKNRFFTLSSALNLLLPFFAIIFIFGSISNMTRNWSLERQVDEKKRKIELLSLEVERLKLENEYYASDEYRELSARRQQNKKLDGETLVYLPANSAEAKNKYKVSAADTAAVSDKSNLDQWLLFLFGEPASSGTK